MQLCTKCLEPKPDDRFGFHSVRGKKYRMHRCKDCVNAEQRARYTPERARGYRANLYAADANYKVKQHLRHNYGITLEQYQKFFDHQKGRCAICGTENNGLRPGALRLSVDHCHTMGAIRGLLCSNCNAGLGRFKDDPVRLENALRYLLRDSPFPNIRAKRTYPWGRKGKPTEH